MEVALQLTDNASLRGMEGHDGKWYFSVYDFINFVTGHEARHRYAQITFSRLVANGSEHAKEVTTNCCDFQFQTYLIYFIYTHTTRTSVDFRGYARRISNHDTPNRRPNRRRGRDMLRRHFRALSNLGLNTQRQ